MINPLASAAGQTERWVLRGGAFTLPLIVSWNGFDQFVLPKLLVARLLVVLLAALYVARLLYQPRLHWKRTPIDLPLLFFVVSAGLSTVVAVNVTTALFGTYSRYEGALTIATYAALFWLTVQLLTCEKDAVGLLHTMLASAYVVSLLSILQAVVGTSGSADIGGLCFTRPYATFGHPGPLAAFLAMLLPVALSEVSSAASRSGRVIAVNLSIVMAIALLVTLSRGAWVGAAVGIAIIFLRRRPSRRLIVVVTVVAGLSLGFAVLMARAAPTGGAAPNPCVARVASLTAPAQGSSGIRLHLWGDTLRLIASRPILGYGPDTFALVYPRFQTGDWEPGHLFDKAHADVLEIAATQGLVGVVVDLWLLAAFVRAFRIRRGRGIAAGVLGGWLAYEVAMEVGFSWVPSAVPFWIFAGAAASIWTPNKSTMTQSGPLRVSRGLLPLAAALVLGLVVVSGSVRGYFADVQFFHALSAGARGDDVSARAAAHRARTLAPEQWVYAAEEGNAQLDLDAYGVPGAHADWQRARAAYKDAVSLGSANPATFRYLAIVDHQLRFQQEAEVAARRAVELDRFDRANQAVLTYVLTTPP